jgi:arylsulfatase A-like enzyme
VDKLLGLFLRRLKEVGFYDRSIIIVTSDHGYRGKWIGDMPLPIPEHLKTMDDKSPRISLIIKAHHIPPGVYDVDYQHVDFVPAVLDVLGISLSGKEFEGLPAFAEKRPRRQKEIIFPRGVYRYDPERKTWLLQGMKTTEEKLAGFGSPAD